MNRESTIKATSRKRWIAFIAISIVFILVALCWKEETLLISHRLTMISTCVILIIYSVSHAVYSAEMNSHEVYCSCFGKEYRSIHWEEVDAIVIARDYRLTFRTSGNTRIIIIPKGCPLSDIKRLGAVLYISRFYKYVIWMDDTEKNREYIRQLGGNLIDYRYH